MPFPVPYIPTDPNTAFTVQHFKLGVDEYTSMR